MNNRSTLLAIESSCDDTGVAVVQREGEDIRVLASLVTSQTDIHEKTGGVIPEIAAREHVQAIGPMITSVMKASGIVVEDIDAIAVTAYPGLMPSLAVGVQAAKTLAYAWNKPIVPVHHIEGHIYSALLEKQDNQFPAIVLIVSGGHTMLISVTDHLTYKVIGETRDDAVGEVFDKVARMLGLSYPGGPKLSVLAKQGNPNAFQFPRPMMNSHDLAFSYSGLKTAVLYQVQALGDDITEQQKADIAASFEQAIVDSLVGKLSYALDHGDYVAIGFAGGVAANERIREALTELAYKRSIDLLIAPKELCGDNAVMIGYAGLFAYEAGRARQWQEVDAAARKNIEECSK